MNGMPTCRMGTHLVPCVSGYGNVVEGRPVRTRRLPCCGLGLGWLLSVSLNPGSPVHVLVHHTFWSFNYTTNKIFFSTLQRFIAGFFLAAIPWYVGAFILICVWVHDHREKPGYVACTIAVSSFVPDALQSFCHLLRYFVLGISDSI
jgi:hypothetical protein